MKKLLISLTMLSMLLAGCNIGKNKESTNEVEQLEGFHFPNDKEVKEMEDNLLTDPKVIQDDKLLYVGDSGLDKSFGENIQNPPNKNDEIMLKKLSRTGDYKVQNVHHSWKYPQLHPTYVNPKVKAIGGSYINNVIGKGWDYYGTPYVLGSDRNNDSSFDCSDFTRWIHLWTLGMDLPKTSSSQWEYVKKFSKRKYTDLSQAKRGDLLFFMSYKGWQPQDYNGINVKAQPVAHCGIYLGDGLVLHTASQKTGGVRYDKLKGSHLEYRFIGGGQVIQ
jgi:peptidoglycan DL-endopeptidase CwlO